MNKSDAYKILGIRSNASEEDIKYVYRNLAKQYHPDVNKSPYAEENFKKINQAYELLTKPQPIKTQTFNPFEDIMWNIDPFDRVFSGVE